MATRNFFFDSVDGDREYNSDTMAQFARGILREGYTPGIGDELTVIESSPPAMSVRVGLGVAWVDGRYFEVFSAPETLTIPAADGSNPRIDRIVVRNDFIERETVLAVKAGTPAASPEPPSLQRDSTIYEISLAQVLVATAETSIEDDDITDERDDENVCGFSEPHGLQVFKQEAPIAVTGSYTGNGGTDRLIATGGTPLFVVVSSSSELRGGISGVTIGVNTTGFGRTSSSNAMILNRLSTSGRRYRPELDNTGFRVRGDDTATINDNGVAYDWLAFVRGA